MITLRSLAAVLLALGPLAPGPAPGPADGLRQVTECVAPGSTGGGGGLALREVHALADGAGVRVAVIDTGVAPHPRLAALTGGGDYLTGGDGLTDCDGHGTAVAGVLAATPSPEDDVVGVAPGVEVVSIRQASPSFTVPVGDGARAAGDTATLAAALGRAVRLGASVVTVSETVCLDAARAEAVGRPLAAALRAAAEADVLVVAAAGNVGSGGCTGAPGEVPLPAGVGTAAGGPLADGVLVVGATTPDDAPAAFTVRGPWVDLAARGTALRSLAAGGGLTAPTLQGTSLAVPVVAGAAALVRQRFPGLSAAAVADRLVATARVPAADPEAVGAGVVDPLAALTALPRPGTAADPVAPRPAAAPAVPRPRVPTWVPLLAVAAVSALVAALPLLARRLRS
ncbi:S8 family serine peptidase [Pseudonocardia oroxyli]|uniref:Membrane-anchored mycosin MYCP n=1 Tax=Pseudonocardia oroxyli TaxID=366584 RepID=A0A1G7GKP5_PSEOR|nr:S8 family serine peptidase [Pseudonocardia oroxyli]SDE88706.1 membrane-anchored mycosin MYCP [Pseudonocardia oroxyli]